MPAGNSKAIFITGATGGIGRALVPMLLARGWKVYAGVNTGAALSAHANLSMVQLDVTDSASVEAAARAVAQTQGEAGLQALVNLAGVMAEGPVELVSDADLRRTFAINVFGPVSVVREFLPLIRSGKGRIVNVTAVTALASGPFFGPVASSKAALAYLSDSLRLELAPQRIPVVNIMPGAMKTEVFNKAAAAFERSITSTSEDRAKLYQPLINGARKALAKQKESNPSVAAKVILTAIESKKPKVRYFAGSDAKLAGNLIPHLPRPIKDKMLLSLVGGGK